jgi:hypothetical protein
MKNSNETIGNRTRVLQLYTVINLINYLSKGKVTPLQAPVVAQREVEV